MIFGHFSESFLRQNCKREIIGQKAVKKFRF